MKSLGLGACNLVTAIIEHPGVVELTYAIRYTVSHSESINILFPAKVFFSHAHVTVTANIFFSNIRRERLAYEHFLFNLTVMQVS